MKPVRLLCVALMVALTGCAEDLEGDLDSDIFGSSCGDTTVVYNLFDMTMDELFDNGEGQLGPRRLVTEQESNIVSLGVRRFIQATPMDIPSVDVVIRKKSGSRIGGKTKFVVCATDANDNVTMLDSFSIKGGKKNIGSVVARSYGGLKDKRLSIRLAGKSPTGSARFVIDIRRPGGEGAAWVPTVSQHSSPVPGFADLHVHQAADLAYSKGWYWGSHREGPESHTMPACTGDNHATLQFLGHDLGIPLIDSHEDATGGFPNFEDWPAWDDIKHQQVSLRWLEDAHDRGLNLMVASLVNNQWLSAAAIASGRHDNRVSPADMESVKRQLQSLVELDEVTPWFTIVRDPWEARRAIEAGQLAVVVAVEVSDVMPPGDGPWKQQLYDLYHMGVRTVQFAHQSNSHFAGAAYHRDPFEINSRIKSWFDRDIEYASGGDGVHNPLGLSGQGAALLEEMIRLGMLLDIAHLSLETQRDIFAIVSTDHDYYPLYNSHTRMDAVLTTAGRDLLREHITTDETLSYVRRTGGVLGLRTGEDPMVDYQNPVHGSYVANNCDGSTRSFAQFYQYADDLGVNLAFGSDFNGFITQIVPRFGPDACINAPGAARQQQIAAQGAKPVGGPAYLQEYYTKGLAHIGLLPAVIDDMDDLGVDTTNIRNSAEAFVQMWERVYDANRGPLN